MRSKVLLDTLEALMMEGPKTFWMLQHLENPGLHGWTMTMNLLELSIFYEGNCSYRNKWHNCSNAIAKMLQKILCLCGGGQINVGWVLFFFVGTVIASRFSLVYLNDNPPLSDIDLLSQIWRTRLSQQWSKTTMLAGYWVLTQLSSWLLSRILITHQLILDFWITEWYWILKKLTILPGWPDYHPSRLSIF
jgi:hypothetical protein